MTFRLDILGFLGGFPVNGEGASGYLITTDKGRLLIDCGSGTLSKLSRLQPIYELDGVILSHLHNDHIADMLTLEHGLIVAERLEIRNTKLPLYCPEEPNETCQRIPNNYFDKHIIDNGLTIELIGARISFFPVHHSIPCYAIRMEYQGKVLVYTGDTAYFPELVEIVKDADILLCEATIVEGSRHTSGIGHMNGSEAGRVAKLANVKQLVLTHLPTDGFHDRIKADAQGEFDGKVSLASEREDWEIKKAEVTI